MTLGLALAGVLWLTIHGYVVRNIALAGAPRLGAHVGVFVVLPPALCLLVWRSLVRRLPREPRDRHGWGRRAGPLLLAISIAFCIGSVRLGQTHTRETRLLFRKVAPAVPGDPGFRTVRDAFVRAQRLLGVSGLLLQLGVLCLAGGLSDGAAPSPQEPQTAEGEQT